MPAAIMRWWQMIHNGGAPTAIVVPPSGNSVEWVTGTDIEWSGTDTMEWT